jgi:Tfp pilus assembly protein PilO
MQAGDLAAFYRYLDRGESIDEWLAKLYGIAIARSLQLQQADYRFADSRYGVERYQIVLPVDGSYADIRHFLDAVLAEIPVLSLDQASFRRRSASAPRVDTELAMTLHVRRR